MNLIGIDWEWVLLYVVIPGLAGGIAAELIVWRPYRKKKKAEQEKEAAQQANEPGREDSA